MDKMSFFSILTSSVPEAVLNIYLAFVLMGQRSKLYVDDLLNVGRLTAAVVLMVTASVCTRAVIHSLSLVFIINTVLVFLIIKYVYAIKFTEALTATIIMAAFLITAEFMLLPPFLTFVSKNYTHILNTDSLRFIYSLPMRGIQLALIISFWKWDVLYLNMRGLKRVSTIFILACSAMLGGQALTLATFLNYIGQLSQAFKIMGIIAGILFTAANFAACRLIITLLKTHTN